MSKPTQVVQSSDVNQFPPRLHSRYPLCGKQAADEYFIDDLFQPYLTQFLVTKEEHLEVHGIHNLNGLSIESLVKSLLFSMLFIW